MGEIRITHTYIVCEIIQSSTKEKKYDVMKINNYQLE